MATKYYIDLSNNYIGGFDGISPVGGIEVGFPPRDARAKWNGSAWVEPIPTTEEKIQKELSKQGYNLDQRVEALWKKIMENDSTEADAIQQIRSDAKAAAINP